MINGEEYKFSMEKHVKILIVSSILGSLIVE